MTDAEIERLVEKIFLLVQDGQVAAAGDLLRASLSKPAPSDIAELVERLRIHGSPINLEAAGALEVQAREIDEIRKDAWLLNGEVKHLDGQIKTLLVENERLREVLEEYAKIEGPPYHGTPFLARAVLNRRGGQ